MNKHTDYITVSALTQWIFSHKDDTACRQAAEILGCLGAVSDLLEMLDSPLIAHCALEVAAALGNHAHASNLHHLLSRRAEFGRVVAMLDVAIEWIEESQGECTCGQCRDAPDGQSGPDGTDGTDGTDRPVVPPTDQDLLN